MKNESVLRRQTSVISNDGVAGEGVLAIYGHKEIRNNRGGKQLAATQVVKISETRDVLLKDSRSKEVSGGKGRGEAEEKGGRRLRFIGHLLACGLQIYRCSAEEENAYGGKRAMHNSKGTVHDSGGSHESCRMHTLTATHKCRFKHGYKKKKPTHT